MSANGRKRSSSERRLYRQDSLIVMYNKHIDKRLHGWAAANPAVLES